MAMPPPSDHTVRPWEGTHQSQQQNAPDTRFGALELITMLGAAVCVSGSRRPSHQSGMC